MTGNTVSLPEPNTLDQPRAIKWHPYMRMPPSPDVCDSKTNLLENLPSAHHHFVHKE